MAGRRRMLTVRISDDARNAIESYCAHHGISVTAWVEALGWRVKQLQDGEPVDEALRSVGDETVRMARLIDKERRARTSSGGS